MLRLSIGLMLRFALLFTATFSTYAQVDVSAVGTYNVAFQPVQAGGKLVACSLNYSATQADFAYLSGKLVVINGNISVNQFDGNLLLGLKVGVKEVLSDKPIVRPHFAYMQTKTKSTALVKQKSNDGEEGYKLFAYSLFDPQVLEFFQEMTDTWKVSIAFNRARDGVDVVVPIELDVVDVNQQGSNFVRKRSTVTGKEFLKCFEKLVVQAKSSLKGK